MDGRFVSIFFAYFLMGPVSALEPTGVFERASQSVVVVIAGDESGQPKSLGSGVILTPGRAVTNCHLLARMAVFVLKQEDKFSLANVIYRDENRDLCLLEADEPSLFPIAVIGTVGVSSLKVGQRVYAIGSPSGLELTLSEGLISSVRTYRGNTVIQTSAPISKGSSGGGLFDADGRLLAITTFYLEDGQNLNFAYPVEYIPSVFFQPAKNQNSEIVPKRQIISKAQDRKNTTAKSYEEPLDNPAMTRLREALKASFVVPTNSKYTSVAEFSTTVDVQGAAKSPKLTRSSGDKNFDEAALMALRQLEAQHIAQYREEEIIVKFVNRPKASWEKLPIADQYDPATIAGYTRFCTKLIFRNYFFPRGAAIVEGSRITNLLVQIDGTGKITEVEIAK